MSCRWWVMGRCLLSGEEWAGGGNTAGLLVLLKMGLMVEFVV